MNITKEQADKVIALADQIACLGNGERPGNSHGNELGKQIATIMRGLAEDAEPVAQDIVFGMRRENMCFTIGNQSFTLNYAPDNNEDFDYMSRMLRIAISKCASTSPQAAQTEAQEREAFEAIYRDLYPTACMLRDKFEREFDEYTDTIVLVAFNLWKAGRSGRKG